MKMDLFYAIFKHTCRIHDYSKHRYARKIGRKTSKIGYERKFTFKTSSWLFKSKNKRRSNKKSIRA